MLPGLDALPSEAIKDRILNSKQAAEFWGVSVPHWRRMTHEKKVPLPPAIKIGERKFGWRLSDLIEAQKQREDS